MPPSIAIVGSGFSGLGMGISLKRAGIDSFEIFEQADRIGGVWRENIYPGAACDVPSYLYSYSWEISHHWTEPYSPQSEIVAYLEHCADKYDVRDHIRFNTGIESATFDEVAGDWEVRTSTGETVRFDVLVTACGQLRIPSYPGIPGLEDFTGAQFHSARWDHSFDVTGKRVAVVGTGASAIQIIPGIVDKVARLDVFQRTAPYVLRKRHRPYHPWERRMYEVVGPLQTARRAGFWFFIEALIAGFTYARWLMLPARAIHEFQLRTQVRDPKLRRKLRPDYAMGCKRLGVSSEFYPALSRPNVEVVTEAIERVTPAGIVTADGVEREVDAIVLATGFRANDFIAPMAITGRGGRTLNDAWSDGAEAYLGMTVSGFPNLFLLYGPNTNLGSGSIIHMLESQFHYIERAIALLGERRARFLDVRAEVQERFNKEVQQRLVDSVWSSCASWYRTPSGRVVNNWPGFMSEYRRRTRHVDADDYDVAA